MNKTNPHAAPTEPAAPSSSRRSFLKKSGGAALATLVAWNTIIQPALANTEGSAKYLVCTAAPTNAARSPQPFADYGISRTNPDGKVVFRRKNDTYQGIGPDKGDAIEIREDAEVKFQITGKIGTYIASEIDGLTQVNRLATAEITQDIVVPAGSEGIEYRANEAVYQVLNGNGGPTGNMDGSPISGGVGIERGVVKAQTLWAGYRGTGGISLGVKVGSLTFNFTGVSNPADQHFTSPPLYWQFRVQGYVIRAIYGIPARNVT